MSRKTRKGRVIVSGILFWYPLAGVTWQFLHYLVGLQRLGYETWYIEDSERWSVYDPRLDEFSDDPRGNIAAIAPVLARYGFGDRWAFRMNGRRGDCHGISRASLDALYASADVLLNVTASQELRDEHLRIPVRACVESDPFPSQVRAARGDAEETAFLDAHTHLFSFGENLGADDCLAPRSRYTWMPTRQPVVLDLWDNPHPCGPAPWTTITTWSNSGKDIEYDGRTWYWTKDREFERLLDLPARTGAAIELATVVDAPTRARLEATGWRLRASPEVSADPVRYRDYIQRSRGELTVARDQYASPRTGWFSDRSACYLAAGRPVVTQDTGFGRFLPTGNGLFAFGSVEEAAAAILRVEAEPERHCRGAREVAEACFDASAVLASLMDRTGL